MFGRFTVRQSEDDDGTYGIWDAAVNGWRRATGLSKAEASRVATDLDIQFDARGPRNPSTVRRLDKPRPVHRAQWSMGGESDVWLVDENGQWYGRFREGNTYTWAPGCDLRPR